jgi:hypothetical protein
MKKVRMSKSKVKAMMIVFFDIRGIIMIEWGTCGSNGYSKVLLGGSDQAPRTSEEEKPRIVEEEIMDSA